MIDSEVMRLRELRNTVLRARAIAKALDSDPERHDSLFSQSALGFWQIARTITGKLRENPYLSYQRGPSKARAVYDRISAGLLASAVQSRGRRGSIFIGELERVARELDDARALTWSPDLSDSLGRSQAQLRALIKEAAVAMRKESASPIDRDARIVVRNAALADDGGSVAGSWPYLAF